MVEMATAIEWAATKRTAVLITLRRDGRAQSSDIAYTVNSGATSLVISITGDRAKTHNMRRDHRVVLHITDPPSWSYLSFDATVSLSEVTTDPHDATADALVEYYEQVAGKPHPDWDEYRAAMVAEKRLLATVTPTSVTGQIN